MFKRRLVRGLSLTCHHVPDAHRQLHMIGGRVDGKLTFRQRQQKRAAKLKLKAEGKTRKVCNGRTVDTHQ